VPVENLVSQVHLHHVPTAEETFDNETAINKCLLQKAHVIRSRYYRAHHQTVD
jgi:hypothetical protein